ncbi:MAG: glycosyltransferase [Phyllobacterium sp.]
MKILNIIQCTDLGGMEQASLRLMQSLQERGHRFKVISLNPLGALKPQLDAAGIEAVGLDYKGVLGWRSVPAFHRIVRNEEADALIMTGSNLLAMLALGKVCRHRRLLAMHFHHSVRPSWQWMLFYHLAGSRFNSISFPSDFVRLEAESIYRFIRPKTCTIRNPLTAPAPHDRQEVMAAKNRLGLPSNTVLVGNAGWLIARKRFDVFLRAAAVIAKTRPEIRFAIAGDGPERPKLQAMADGLGLAGRIHWLGWISTMRDFYISLDVLLFNSDWDAFGNTPVEAMTYGIPVVASVENGGLKEVIPDERFGYLFSEHDPQRLAAAVLDCIAQKGCAVNGRDRAVALSDPERIAGEVEKILESPVRDAAISPTRLHRLKQSALDTRTMR